MNRKVKKVLLLVGVSVIAAIIVAGVILCIFFMLIGFIANDARYFGYGWLGIGIPIIVPTLIGDIKDLFF